MRIHANNLTTFDLYRAARDAKVTFVRLEGHGSRSHNHAFDVVLSGSSPYRTQADGRQDFAATWDEWGVFFANLFLRDDSIMVGNKSWGYRDRDDFDRKTDERFTEVEPIERPEGTVEVRAVLPADTHPRHKWRGIGDNTQACAHCTAIFRWK
jgi:hypothetical protein